MTVKLPYQYLRLPMLVVALVSSMLTTAVAANIGPKEVIEDRYQAFLGLVESKAIVAGMPKDELFNLMEKELDPVVDFSRIARKVMGKYSRQASADQMTIFTESFKKTLVNTYAKGLENIDKLKTVDIEEAVIDDKGKRAKVNSFIKLSTGEQYQVVYSLFLDKSGAWKVENLVVEGVNIGIVFRNQFAQYMEQYGSVDKAIANWGN